MRTGDIGPFSVAGFAAGRPTAAVLVDSEGHIQHGSKARLGGFSMLTTPAFLIQTAGLNILLDPVLVEAGVTFPLYRAKVR
jgi:hypothetical protein